MSGFVLPEKIKRNSQVGKFIIEAGSKSFLLVVL
jgi:hypothetical protein